MQEKTQTMTPKKRKTSTDGGCKDGFLDQVGEVDQNTQKNEFSWYLISDQTDPDLSSSQLVHFHPFEKNKPSPFFNDKNDLQSYES